MLVLTRKSDESVMVGSNIEIKVLGIRGDQVSLGFTAPHEISIYRKEVYEAIQKENIQAVKRGEGELEKLKNSLGQHFARRKTDHTNERRDEQAN
ncbi:MAG TPA: carbon storage regulator [Verrucomicrobia bacterium]|nr:MAG: carbon storage regulator [Lentisphaerae bacterium GWF2_57_35]HBA83826.1 carbon storage regulator [Verrucomicrobiota bacterium]